MPRYCPPEPPPTPKHLRCLCVRHVHKWDHAPCTPESLDRIELGYETGFEQIWPTCPQHGWSHDWSTPEGMAAATWLLIVGHDAYRKDPCRLGAQMREATRLPNREAPQL